MERQLFTTASASKAARCPELAIVSTGTPVAVLESVAPFFAAWVLLAMLLYVMGLGQQAVERQNVSNRATAAPTRLSGVDAPDVRPMAKRPARGNHPVAVTSVFDPTGR
jgi:hypothetical protein